MKVRFVFVHDHDCPRKGEPVVIHGDDEERGWAIWPRPLCTEPGRFHLSQLTQTSVHDAESTSDPTPEG